MATANMTYLTVAACLIAAVAANTTQYSNHTVGGAAGWLFNATTKTAAANYSAWAASQTFNLGDYLIFNTNTNQTVIQTYNETTYSSCTIDDTSDDDAVQYGGGSENFGQPATIAVPLTIKGKNYYFSDANDGFQCEHGMAFEIFVNRGLGLPPSLNQPPPPPYAPPPSPPEAQAPPVTVIGNQPTGGGMKVSANIRWLTSAVLLGILWQAS
ncbi:cucumber peeling cupredoxin-like [Diospyros lotus]|uniref:cucumber peeling cupredoxin-like n=1 Tax=Diospyros lotus TaxID=55363 RepID=UPI002258A00F|nr:cucumber peeling cupredoxin-like [Diospyros lotus]